MLLINPDNLLELSLLATIWLTLVITAVFLARWGRHHVHDHHLPLDALVTLDVCSLAYLAGGSGRLRDVTLACLFTCGALQLEPQRKKSVLVGGELPTSAHPFEVTLHTVALANPRIWLRSCHEATMKESPRYREALLRQDLLVDPARTWALLPATAAWCLALTLSILSIIGLVQNRAAQDSGGDLAPGVKAMIVAGGLGIAGCCLGLMFTMATLFRNRRGDFVLAEQKHAAAGLDPQRRREWLDLAPHELVQAVALFGLGRWAGRSPLAELHGVLYPPVESSSGG